MSLNEKKERLCWNGTNPLMSYCLNNIMHTFYCSFEAAYLYQKVKILGTTSCQP